MIFGNFFINYIINRVLAQNHPTKDYEHCLNRHQIKYRCSICEQVCPIHAYSGDGSKNADFTECMNCNLCVTACPARCIASSAINVSAYLSVLKTPEKTVYIASGTYEGEAHLRAECFAALSWEYLACVGMIKKVVFLTEGMPPMNSQTEEIWKNTLRNLNYFFGKEEFERRFTFLDRPLKTQALEISRRELFEKAEEGLKSRLASLVPSERMMDGLLYRYLLRDLIAGNRIRRCFGWVIPMISVQCKGCGVCASLCPQEAITVQKNEKEFQLLFYPFRCNHCGLCEKVCIHKAIAGFGVAQIRNLNPIILYKSVK